MRNNKQICNHRWKDDSIIILTNKSGASVPRRIQICQKCGEMIHLPVYTLNELMQKELYGGGI